MKEARAQRGTGYRMVARLVMVFWTGVPSNVRGQAALDAIPDAPLIALAWDAGCLTTEECSMLSEGMEEDLAGVWTQQAIARHLGQFRAREVMPCLTSIPEWQRVFSRSLAAPGRREGSGLSVRLQRNVAVGDSPGLNARCAWRHLQSNGLGAGLRLSQDSDGEALLTGYLHRPGTRSEWWVGSLAARFGQGLIQWTPGAFDDLGGMEGSHRIGTGIRPSGWRARGVLDGAGWRKGQLGREARLLPNWCLAGRVWPGRNWSAAMGNEGRRSGWVLRFLESNGGTMQALGGLHGGGQGRGWSWRWGGAAFRKGWEGRMSLLHSWSRHWEGHLMMRRDHPGHPRWAAGEFRSGPVDEETRPGGEINGGLAFDGRFRGWFRMGFQWSGPPPFRVRRTSAIRVEYGAMRSQFRTSWSAEEARGQDGVLVTSGAPEWSWELRRQGTLPLPADGTWRIHLVVAGSESGTGAGWALVMAWKQLRGQGFRWGVAQSWGAESAPARYVQGWDGRPAVALKGAGAQGYFHWRSPDGAWRCGVNWRLRGMHGRQSPQTPSSGIHAIRVEFRPQRASRRVG